MVMADCPFTKVAVMQLFYELKQKFPTIPDQVVSDLIVQTAYNRTKCEAMLSEARNRSELHSYPVNILSKMTEGKERPKTLALANCDPLLNFESSSPPPPPPPPSSYTEEERQPDNASGSSALSVESSEQTSPALDSIGYHKTVFSDSAKAASAAASTPSDLCTSVQNIEITNHQSEVFVSDLKVCVQNDTSGCERTSLQVTYTKSPTACSQSAPTTPSSFDAGECDQQYGCDDPDRRKHRSSLVIDRSPSAALRAPEAKRPSTSVMLTLRPPSAEGQQPLVSIAANGSQLRYATSNYNPKDGYQNQLEIKIGEDGNPTLTASRLKTTNSIIPAEQTDCNAPALVDPITDLLPALDKALSPTLEVRLREQRERKQRLKAELNRNKQRLKQINQEILVLGRDLESRRRAPHQSEKVVRLRQEVQKLREECSRMVNEIESREHSVGFISTGGHGNVGHWICGMCTFINHPMLPKCEQCDMARVDISNSLGNILHQPVMQIAHPLSFTHPRV